MNHVEKSLPERSPDHHHVAGARTIVEINRHVICEHRRRFGKETPCFARFDSALAESHSKSPSTTVDIALFSMVYSPYEVKSGPVRSVQRPAVQR